MSRPVIWALSAGGAARDGSSGGASSTTDEPGNENAVPSEWNESFGPAGDPSVLRRHLRRHVQRDRACPHCADVGDTVVAVTRMDAHGDPWNPIEVGEYGVVTEIHPAAGCLPYSNRLGTDEV